MKTIRIFFSIAFLLIAGFSFAQTIQKETLKVWGECGMCKKTIEKAAKQAGASTADWNVKTKMLTVAYSDTQTDISTIEKAIATAGYDTKDFSASDDAYKNLETCCQYKRKEASTGTTKDAKCCKDGKKEKCSKDAKAGNSKSCCKDKKVAAN